ncbi:hypothetical protein AB0G29_35415 [Streptomyces parvus]|uniref:hypothetical protein n=1 Tax=Streptomyces parvus TaxID=66428 RepID=UPI0033D13605
MTMQQNETITPVELEGLTGLPGQEIETDAERWKWHMAAWHTAHPDATEDAQREEGLRLIALNDVLRRYNTLRYRLVVEEVAREARDEALQLVETLWQRLGDPEATGNWLHTHQAYVRALDDVRITVGMWQERAEAAKAIVFITDGTGYRDQAFRQILAAGHPRIEVYAGNPSTEAEQLLMNHHQAAEHRGRLLAQTLDHAAQAVAR